MQPTRQPSRHSARQTLAARRFAVPLLLPAALILSGCGTLQSLPWFQKEMMPEPVVMPPPEPEVMAQEMAPPEPIPEEPQFLQMPPPPMMSRPQRPRVASNRRPPPRAPQKEPPKELPPPPPAPATLVGADYTGVLKVLRRPDSMQNSALSVVWTYADPDCTLQLFFYPDIETKTFHLLKYDLKNAEGDRLDGGACMQQFVAMRTDGVQSQGAAQRADSDRR